MKSERKRRLGGSSSMTVCILFGITALWVLASAASVEAQTTTISGESSTILRLRETQDNRRFNSLYEYLQLRADASLAGQGTFSAALGGWGRTDLRDRSAERWTDGDLRYGYVTYAGQKDNLLINTGRQFIAEGVAAERLDGIYLRGDLAAGFGAAAFIGSPVTMSQPGYPSGDFLYGGRITHSLPQYYSIGISALHVEERGGRLREEKGVDLWLQPMPSLEVVGRSSYNSLTSGWMEHAYTATYRPLEALSVSVDLSKVNYRDFFHNVTTSVFSLRQGIIDPNESFLSVGGIIAYLPSDKVVLSLDYKDYSYEMAGRAKYFGGKATFAASDSFSAGLSLHRMDGESARLSYDEYRLFASKKVGPFDFTLDLFDVRYDSYINGTKDAYYAAAGLGWAMSDRMRVAADVELSRTPDFDKDVRGMVIFTYSFDKKFGSEGRAASEKR